MRRSLAAGLLCLCAASSASAAPGEPIGATLSVINVVTAEFNRDTRTLQTGDNVRQNELIDVSKDASTELKLNDDTKLALGPGAKLLLDKFVYDADQSSGSIGVDLVEGAFRFITGVAKKPSYVVKVPRASITVRGTIFDVYVQPDETTWLLLHEGAVRVCNERGQCRDHEEPGKLIRVTDKGDVGPPVRWAKLDGSDGTPFDTAFPFVAKPPSIDPNPVFTADEIIKLGAIEQETKKPRRASTDDDGDKPSKSKRKKNAKAEDEAKPTKKTPVKVVTPKPAKEKTKKVRTTGNTKNDEAAAKALGIAVGIGVGIGLGKIGGGGGKGGGKMGGGNSMGTKGSGKYR